MAVVPRERVNAVRSFNRFITGHVGALNQQLLHSPFSLTEARILYELANDPNLTASALSKDLQLDKAYISRILRKFKVMELLEEHPSERDRREKILCLTPKGTETYAGLNQASHEEMSEVLSTLSETEQQSLVTAMHQIQKLLDGDSQSRETYVIRTHRPGDIGQIISGHGVLYTEEHGWDETFEGFVAEIAGQFLQSNDPKREHCWVAERDGKIVGSAFVVDAGDDVSQLRMLFVDRSARGFGIGDHLLKECLRFAKTVGYQSMKLWTTDNLEPARRLYQSNGFALKSEKPYHSFGKDLISQIWDRDL